MSEQNVQWIDKLTFFFSPVEMFVKWPVSSSGCSCCNISCKVFWFLFSFKSPLLTILRSLMYLGYYFKCINNVQGCVGVSLVICWCFIWVLVELNIIIVKEKPCQHGYSQEETKYDYSMKSCIGKQESQDLWAVESG